MNIYRTHNNIKESVASLDNNRVVIQYNCLISILSTVLLHNPVLLDYATYVGCETKWLALHTSKDTKHSSIQWCNANVYNFIMTNLQLFYTDRRMRELGKPRKESTLRVVNTIDVVTSHMRSLLGSGITEDIVVRCSPYRGVGKEYEHIENTYEAYQAKLIGLWKDDILRMHTYAKDLHDYVKTPPRVKPRIPPRLGWGRENNNYVNYPSWAAVELVTYKGELNNATSACE
jgi:hypothetical protein